jgi:hypothetical protein
MSAVRTDSNGRVIPRDISIQIAGITGVLERAGSAMRESDVAVMIDMLSQVIDTIGEQKELLKELEELEEDNNEVGFY